MFPDFCRVHFKTGTLYVFNTSVPFFVQGKRTGDCGKSERNLLTSEPYMEIQDPFLLPESCDWIRIEGVIGADDRDLFHYCLSNQHSIKRVFMVLQQLHDRFGMHGCYSQTV